MALLTNLLFVVAYALAAVFVAMMLPQAWPGLGHTEALTAAVLVFLIAALLHESSVRRSGERELLGALVRVRRAEAETADDLSIANREIERLRHELVDAEQTTRQRLDAELSVVRTLLGQLARHIEGGRLAAPAARPVPRLTLAPQPEPVPAGLSDVGERDLVDAVQDAIQGNRVDLYLQPVVSLPQRKVRYYEAFSRLRDETGKVLMPDRYLPVAERTGLITTIDNMLLFRCVQLLRKLKRRNRTIGFFCNISLRTLNDESFFEQFTEFLAADATLVENLFFEITSDSLGTDDAAVDSRLRRLEAMGFAFSLDQVPGLDIDYAGLARRNFRFVKIQAAKLLSPDAQSRAPLALSDLKEAFRRHGISLIAEKVETEKMVVDLLDYDVDYGQGYLFGEPKLSRGEF